MMDKTATDILKLAVSLPGDAVIPAGFIKDMERLGFSHGGGGWDYDDESFLLSEREMGYDNDLDYLPRDEAIEVFNEWASPIVKKAKGIARKHRMDIDISTSAEYGDIEVRVKT